MNGIVEEKLELPNENIKKLIDKVVRDRGFVNYDMELSAGSKKGDNYIGIVYRIKISGKKENGESGKFNLFCKIPPTNEARRNQFKIRETFGREALMYNKILPAFQRFAQEKGITEDGFEAYPKCYAANIEDGNEYILMEDLRVDGFTMFDRHCEADFGHAKLLMEQLGKLHALSFAMKDQDKEMFSELSKLHEVLWIRPMDPAFEAIVKSSISTALGVVDEADVEHHEMLKNYEKTHIERLYHSVDSAMAEPYSVICHGDCWNNNLLFKYEDGKPVEISLLDWQIARYASPVLDLLYYIFCCTEKPLRDEHYDDLLRVYHGTLSKFLTRLGSDPEKLFPYSALQEQLKKFGDFALCMGALLIRSIVTHPDDTPNLDEISEKMQHNPDTAVEFHIHNDNTVRIFNQRMADVIRDIVRLGYV